MSGPSGGKGTLTEVAGGTIKVSGADARSDSDGDQDAYHIDCILGALRQLRLEHGNHPCYDAIETSVMERTGRIRQLTATLRVIGDAVSGAIQPV